MLTLPPELDGAIARALGTTHPSRWVREAQALSERYRAPRLPDGAPLVSNAAQALGYAAIILPATYAQLYGAMAATAARIPAWQPATLLDLGSGPGTALWAAAAVWPTISRMVAWEREAALIALGRELASASSAPAVRATRWERADLRTLSGVASARHPTYDLVVLGHVLNELPPDARPAIIDAAWRLAGGLLLIVEPGDSASFAVVRAARDQLLSAGARTIAPCAHDRPCPLENDWCHFPQRLRRPAFQRRARGAPSEWEDAKFAYAALARFLPEQPIWGRVIREPQANKAYAEAKLSTRDGVAWYRALKRHKEAFRRVKDLRWGEALPEPLPAPIEPVTR
jgi:ribosomal protein RSM22 (predicted rRNA methylase)